MASTMKMGLYIKKAKAEMIPDGNNHDNFHRAGMETTMMVSISG